MKNYGNELFIECHEIQELLKYLLQEVNNPFDNRPKEDFDEKQILIEELLKTNILVEDFKLYYDDLFKIHSKIVLRMVALVRVKERESRRGLFRNLFRDAEEVKKQGNIQRLNETLNSLMLFKARIEQYMKMTKIVMGNIKDMADSLNTHLDTMFALDREENGDYHDSIIIQERNSRIWEQLKKELSELCSMLKIVSPRDAKEIEGKNIYNFNEIATYKKLIELYAYRHQNELEAINLQIQFLTEQSKKEGIIVKDVLTKFDQLITDLMIKSKIFRQFGGEKTLLNAYEGKLIVLSKRLEVGYCSKRFFNPQSFYDKSDDRELSYYYKIIESRLQEIQTGENEFFKKEFGSNSVRALEIFNEILEKRSHFISGRDILDDSYPKILEFILSFNTENGLEEFVKRKLFDQKNLALSYGHYDKDWDSDLSLETLYQFEDMMRIGDNKVSPWVKLLRLGKTSKRIPRIRDMFERKLVFFPTGLKCISDVSKEDIKKQIKNREGNHSLFVYNRKIRKFWQDIQAMDFVTFAEGMEKVYDYAFASSRILKSVVFSKTMKTIGKRSFVMCTNLERVELKEGLESIGVFAFGCCERLKTIKFPQSLKCIDVIAFRSCVKLESIELPDALETLNAEAFAYCEELHEISIPSKKIAVGYGVFNCIGHKQINLVVRGLEIEEGCIEAFLSGGMQQIKSIEVMDGGVVAVHYDIDSEDGDITEIVAEIMQKVDEYKKNKKEMADRLKKLSLTKKYYA